MYDTILVTFEMHLEIEPSLLPLAGETHETRMFRNRFLDLAHNADFDAKNLSSSRNFVDANASRIAAAARRGADITYTFSVSIHVGPILKILSEPFGSTRGDAVPCGLEKRPSSPADTPQTLSCFVP